ncbi:DNA alkylation repair protein [Candidatus Saccharibacteria bacterium RIFCSPHIGHO2_12_FULL_41_12]|nr:MAG: DNA alkylation repair protein [Candidatus Saccharibacteria bacterium RIFCSPHIGHO2_12_FULL_41_12]
MTAEDFELAIQKYASDSDASFLQRFFKTGEGEYGEGDVFIGARVPDTRKVCKVFKDLSLGEIQKLLDSPIHEHRLAAVILLVNQFNKNKQKIFDLYLNNVYRNRVNNWDIVDSSAHQIVGGYLIDKPRDLLFDLASSDNLWQRRVAVLATFHFIKNGHAVTSIELAEKLLKDNHDLIHKAVGWMLREVGGRVDEAILIDFLDKHAHEMPRTMLRYSIEKLPEQTRQHYLKLK